MKKQLGIWMDHSIAHLTEFTNDRILTSTIESPYKLEDKLQNLKNETLMQNKEQNQLSDYFKKLSDVIEDYNEVLLFGPTDAKTELFNLLIGNRHFDKIKIGVKSADKMTENQQLAFIKDYFNTPAD